MEETKPPLMVMMEMAEMKASAAGFDGSKNVLAVRVTLIEHTSRTSLIFETFLESRCLLSYYFGRVALPASFAFAIADEV